MALPKGKGAEISITALGLGSKLPFGKSKSMGRKPSDEEEEAEGESPDGPDSSDGDYGQEMAGEELLSALESKDAKGIYDAIAAIVDLCGGSKE